MDSETKLQYQGFISTPPLWAGNRVSAFKQIELPKSPEPVDDVTVFKHRRLGKLVEEFVFHQLKNLDAVSWICDNLQIHQSKRTVGEIDALYFYENTPVHLEVAYKFYLLDTIQTYTEPLAYWIGPNRKDSLFYKLGKLDNKQFPLLHDDLTKSYLDKYNLDAKEIEQQLCFKAQLFLPCENKPASVTPLNSDCIAGFYVSYEKIELLKNCSFFIPTKLDWLVVPHHDVNWINFSSALEVIELDISQKRSPLVWIKQNDGELSKWFIVFW